MQSTNFVHGVSFRKNPRKGQLRVFDSLEDRSALNVQLPTGYGKTLVNTGTYSILKHKGRVNRLLIIFPTDAQLEQFKEDGADDLADAGVDGPLEPVDIRFWGSTALKKHRKNEAQIFLITIQSLEKNRGANNVKELLEVGRWMITVDEYHHYGVEKSWGKTVLALSSQFILAMSATPDRPNDDSAFGSPAIVVTYREAVAECAVKPLIGHSYVYQVDAILDGEVRSYTTDEFVTEVGSDDSETIDKWMIEKDMRWSPKYVSPLVTIPIERMLKQRIETGVELKALVTAMSVSHAKLVYEQIKSLFPHLVIDWVGTGKYGRSSEENKQVLKAFKTILVDREKKLIPVDVLVHVGIAGEGLNIVNISETTHLKKASINNTNNQINGRTSRYVNGVTGHINFDSSSAYAALGYLGDSIMDAMDGRDAQPYRDDYEESDNPLKELPEWKPINIYDMRLKEIRSGDPQVQRVAKALNETGYSLPLAEMLEDQTHPKWNDVIAATKIIQAKEADKFNEESRTIRARERVQTALISVTKTVLHLMFINAKEVRIEKSLRGDIMKRINTRKKMLLGGIINDVEICEKHYLWLDKLQKELIAARKLPTWLS
jgi:superfamily II DNA or RNA helicase